MDMREPDAAVFTIMRKEEQGPGGMGGGGGYVAQGSYYSEDGNWMWNGSEWVPAR